MISFYLKKWYLDLITDDGIVIYLYFMATKIAGIQGGNISAHIMQADGKSHGATMNGKIRLLDSRTSAAFGPSFLANQPAHAHARMEYPQLGVDFQYRLSGDSWIPATGGLLLERNGACLSWKVPFPSARVEGRLRLGSQQRQVCGTGYQDVVEMTFPPWRLPIAELTWGRAHCGGHTLIFDRLRLTDGACVQYLLLQADDGSSTPVESRMFAIETTEDDSVTRIRQENFVLVLNQRHILAQSAIAAGGQIRPRWLAKALARSSGDPFEKKMAADAELTIGSAVYRGTAIHERVSWRWQEIR